MPVRNLDAAAFVRFALVVLVGGSSGLRCLSAQREDVEIDGEILEVE